MKRAEVAVVLGIFLALYLTLVTGQCDQRERGGPLTCCRGRNSSCAVERYIDDENNKRPTRRICFCDGFCELAGDCCPDFARVKQECKIQAVVQDCVVSTWSRWTSCSHHCGIGRQKRHRDVVVKPSQGGGKTCPPLRQRRGCFLKHCGESAGMARVLPIIYERLPSRYEKILPAKRKSLKQEKKRPSYCAMFKIESKHPYCEGTWAKDLDPLTPICVECQDSAMDENGHCKGHGVLGNQTSWDAVDIYSCHGEWLRFSPLMRNCSCKDKNFNNFIFV